MQVKKKQKSQLIYTDIDHSVFQKVLGAIDASFDLQQMDPAQLSQYPFTSNAVFITDRFDSSQMIKLLHSHPQLNHAFSLPSSEKIPWLEKIFSQMGKSSSISDFCPATRIKKHEIRRYSEKNHLLNQVKEFVAELNQFAELSDIAAAVSSELIMNAVFDAPVDANTGTAKYANLPRTNDVRLAENEKIEFSFAFHNEMLVLSARDPFGTLTREKIVSNLYRCDQKGPDQIRQQSGGAGVGLYLLLSMCHHLDISIDPNRSTEVIAMIHATKRLKDYEQRGVGFNLFVRGQT